MGAVVRMPASLLDLTGGEHELRAEGRTVLEVLDELDRRYPGLRARLFDARGVRRFINIYVRDEDIRALDGPGTVVGDGDEILILPAIAGG